MRGSSGGAQLRLRAHDARLMPQPDPNGPAPDDRLAKRLALEGGGDLRAAFLKNPGTYDHEQPQGGEERKGA